MTFGRESEMAQPVRDWLERQRLWVKQEFSVPWGICDFVAVSLNARRVAKRLQFGQVSAIGPLRRIALLQHIPDKETGRTITQYQLEKLCGASSELIEAELKKLIASGFVTCTRPGSLMRSTTKI